MTLETALLIILGLLCALLSVLLVLRIRSEKRAGANLQGMSLQEFSEFLLSNSLDGKILTIAGKVSEVLKSACKCERIIFLRKQRGMLEMNYYYGMTAFSRTEFRTKYTPELATVLRKSFLPQELNALRGVLPKDLFERLAGFGIDLFFPIFWRDNLYGVYFLKSSPHTDNVSFGVMVAGLAHSLSAAYHVRWQEAKLEKLQQRQAQPEPPKVQPPRLVTQTSHILKLVRHRNTETLVPRIVDAVQRDLGMQRSAYFTESKDDATHAVAIRNGLSDRPEAPPRAVFRNTLQLINPGGMKSLEALATEQPDAKPWFDSLREHGFAHLANFPLHSHRPGLLALDRERPAPDLARRLHSLLGQAQEMFDNAHSFELLEELSFTDNLTGLSNQRYFRKRLAEEVHRARRYQRNLALIMFDLDDLKGINDTHGHLAGDEVIGRFGPILRNSIRTIDIIARYGGDEFCVIMPEADSPTCIQFMQRLKTKLDETVFSLDDPPAEIRCTISVGGAIFPLHADSDQKLIFAADMALLTAKARGRNQYLLYSPETMIGTT
ncbi:MAG: GGDEF domain-containing protein [bacterium]|nr:GGDEF domain-containing protein [bacterium]